MATANLTRGIGYWIQDNSANQNSGASGDDWKWYVGTWSERGTSADAVYGAGCVGYSVPTLSGGIASGSVTIPCTFLQNWNVSGSLNAVLSTTAPSGTQWRFGPPSGVISDVKTFTYTATSLNFTLNDNADISGKTIYLYLYATKGVDFGVVTNSFGTGTLTYTVGGLSYIGEKAYQAYIEDGYAWHRYAPNEEDGESWAVCN